MRHDNPICSRQTAIARHNELRATKASLLEQGKFYVSLLEQGVWPSQRAIATALGVSLSQVSRMVAAARLPIAILTLFANRPLSFRNVVTLQTLTERLGDVEVTRRASCVTNDCSVEEIVSVLTTGREVLPGGVKVRMVPGQKYFRLDVPNFEKMIPRIAELEAIVDAVLATYNSRHLLGAIPAIRDAVFPRALGKIEDAHMRRSRKT